MPSVLRPSFFAPRSCSSPLTSSPPWFQIPILPSRFDQNTDHMWFGKTNGIYQDTVLRSQLEVEQATVTFARTHTQLPFPKQNSEAYSKGVRSFPEASTWLRSKVRINS